MEGGSQATLGNPLITMAVSPFIPTVAATALLTTLTNLLTVSSTVPPAISATLLAAPAVTVTASPDILINTLATPAIFYASAAMSTSRIISNSQTTTTVFAKSTTLAKSICSLKAWPSTRWGSPDLFFELSGRGRQRNREQKDTSDGSSSLVSLIKVDWLSLPTHSSQDSQDDSQPIEPAQRPTNSPKTQVDSATWRPQKKTLED